MKGQMDLPWMLVAVTVGAIGIFIALFLLSAFHSAAPILFNKTTNPTGASTYSTGNTAVNYLSSLIVLIYIAGIFIAAILASFVDTNPAFAFIGLFVLLVVIVLAVIMHNVFFTFTQNTVFGGLGTPTDTMLLFEYYPIFAAVGWFIIMIFTYGKGGGGSGYGSRYGG